jgi:ketosteroid isomerase-like protein
MTTTTHTFDGAALRRAIEARDASTVLDLYDTDATIERVDADNPPSAPKRIAGRDAIRSMLEDVYSRDITHRVERVAVGDDAVGYAVRCEYPDGTRVVCSSVAELRDGRIAREIVVQAWDS